MVKHAEELSYQDKLTGLRNRNYLESVSYTHLDVYKRQTCTCARYNGWVTTNVPITKKEPL